MIKYNGKVYCCTVKGDGIIYIRKKSEFINNNSK